MAPSCLFHSRGMIFPRRAEAQPGLGWSVALWVTTNFSECPPGTAGLWIPPLVDQKIQIQTRKTSLASRHSYLGPLISIPPDSPPYPPNSPEPASHCRSPRGICLLRFFPRRRLLKRQFPWGCGWGERKTETRIVWGLKPSKFYCIRYKVN